MQHVSAVLGSNHLLQQVKQSTLARSLQPSFLTPKLVISVPCKPSTTSRKIVTRAIVKRSPKRLKYAAMGSNKGEEVTYVQPEVPDASTLLPIASLIKNGAVGIIPTDTVYAIVCDLKNSKAVERLYRIKEMNPKKPLSILCRSFKDIDTYTYGFPRGGSLGQRNIFREVKKCFPGPYTFILKASKEMPKQCITFGGSRAARCAPRSSVGVRIPNDDICQGLLDLLDEPLLCTSATWEEGSGDNFLLEPAAMMDKYGCSDRGERIDFFVDGGVRVAHPSTVVDFTGSSPLILREGKGAIEEWMLPVDAEDEVEGNPYSGWTVEAGIGVMH